MLSNRRDVQGERPVPRQHNGRLPFTAVVCILSPCLGPQLVRRISNPRRLGTVPHSVHGSDVSRQFCWSQDIRRAFQIDAGFVHGIA